MVQDIIAYVIVASAFGILFYRILRFFNFAHKKSALAGKCSGCSSGCSMKELHVANKTKFDTKEQYKFYL